MSVPALLGREGVREIPELALEPVELAALRASAKAIAEQIAALESARA